MRCSRAGVALWPGSHGSDYLREIGTTLASGGRVSLVRWPSSAAAACGARFRRPDARLSVRSSAKWSALSLLWNPEGTAISVGGRGRARDFVREYQREGEESMVRADPRPQICLDREER